MVTLKCSIGILPFWGHMRIYAGIDRFRVLRGRLSKGVFYDTGGIPPHARLQRQNTPSLVPAEKIVIPAGSSIPALVRNKIENILKSGRFQDVLYNLFLSPHSHIPSSIGIRDLPRSVREYSTLGGICGYSSLWTS